MKFYKLSKNYSLCIRNRNNLPYHKFWFRKSTVIFNNKSMGYDIGIYLYFFHISIYIDPFR